MFFSHKGSKAQRFINLTTKKRLPPRLYGSKIYLYFLSKKTWCLGDLVAIFFL